MKQLPHEDPDMQRELARAEKELTRRQKSGTRKTRADWGYVGEKWQEGRRCWCRPA